MILKNLFKGVRNKVMIALAGLTMVFGVGAAVSNVVSAQQNEVVETKAVTSCTVYYALSETARSGYTVKYNANIGDNNTWVQGDMTDTGKTYQGLKIWTGTFSAKYDGVDALQFQLYDRSTWKSQEQPISSWAGQATFNGKMRVQGGSQWIEYSYDISADLTLYVDAGNWGDLSSKTLKVHYWDRTQGGADQTGTTVTSVSGGTTYNNKQYWSFGFTCGDTSSLQFLFYYDNYVMQTGNITYSSSVNAYQVSSGKGDAPAYSFNSDGSLYRIRFFEKVDSDSSVQIGDASYLLGGLSYHIDDDPIETKAGYVTPANWNENETATGAAHAPDSWISDIFCNYDLYAVYHDRTGYFLVGDGSFGSFTIETGTPASEGEGNVAYYERTAGFAVSEISEFQFQYRDNTGAVTYYWTLAANYDFARNVSSDEGTNIEIDPGNYNFYLATDYLIYIVDVSAVNTYGHLYFASSLTDTAITVTTYAGAEQVISKTLHQITGVQVTPVTVSFDGYIKLYRIPIYNLRGSRVDKVVTSATFSDGSRTITGIPNVTTSPEIYAKSGAATDAKGKSAKALFDVAMALADGASLCDLSSEWNTLKSTIETGYNSGDTTLMNGAAVQSWASTAKTSFKSWTMQEVYLELCVLTNTKTTGIPAWPLPASLIPAAMKNDQSPLTTTLWIVFGCGLAGLGAIGTAYFVSKKKKKNHVA